MTIDNLNNELTEEERRKKKEEDRRTFEELKSLVWEEEETKRQKSIIEIFEKLRNDEEWMSIKENREYLIQLSETEDFFLTINREE